MRSPVSHSHTGSEEDPNEKEPSDLRKQHETEKAVQAMAIACDLAAEILAAGGRDGLALTARTTAHLIRLTATFACKPNSGQQ